MHTTRRMRDTHDERRQHPLVSIILGITLVGSPTGGIAVGVIIGINVVAEPGPVDLGQVAFLLGTVLGLLAAVIIAAIGVLSAGLTEHKINRRRSIYGRV